MKCRRKNNPPQKKKKYQKPELRRETLTKDPTCYSIVSPVTCTCGYSSDRLNSLG